MPRKKSVRRSARRFQQEVAAIQSFAAASAHLTDAQKTWVHEYAVIKLYREFESLMLDALTGAINNDTAVVAATLGIALPRHLTDEVCRFLITGTGYFDFKGRDGLIRALKKFVPEHHYLVEAVRRPRYREPLERLSALRNFAAHNSPHAKNAALEVVGLRRMSSVGAWLKRQDRLEELAGSLRELAEEIRRGAPY